MKTALVMLLMLAACGGSSESRLETRKAALGALAFDVPATWHRSDPTGYVNKTAMWAPEDNTDKESVTVIRSEVSVAIARADDAALARLLLSAQRSLPDLHASQIIPVRTEAGLSGVRIEVDFVPAGRTDRYHRVHVVLREGDTLVHVLYTSRSPSEDQQAFNLVLHTLHHEEA